MKIHLLIILTVISVTLAANFLFWALTSNFRTGSVKTSSPEGNIYSGAPIAVISPEPPPLPLNELGTPTGPETAPQNAPQKMEKPKPPSQPAGENQKTHMDAQSTSVYYYNFKVPGVLYETGSIEESRSVYWWLNSGAQMLIENGIGKTLQGNLAENSAWRLYYEKDNPLDTDNGYRPQNIFRLFTRKTWKNFREEMFFRIEKDNLSQSSNRNESNGLLLISRAKDGNNLYYAGIRVDGAAVIKKKKNGEYYILAYDQIFPGTYSRETNPNLLPKNQWLGIRSEIVTNSDNTVAIKLFVKLENDKDWRKILEAKDDNKTYGGSAMPNEGYGGVRTDFMDVSFRDFKITEI